MKIDDKKLEELYSRLRPVVSVDSLKFMLKKYTLEEIKSKPLLYLKNTDKEEYLDKSNIEVVGSFEYMKEYENPLSVNITISDILSGIPEVYKNGANAFEVDNTAKIVDKYHSVNVRTYNIRKK